MAERELLLSEILEDVQDDVKSAKEAVEEFKKEVSNVEEVEKDLDGLIERAKQVRIREKAELLAKILREKIGLDC